MLYILTPLFCVALLCGTVFSFSKTGDKVYAASSVKANSAYLDLDGSGNILNGFEGAQKENIYFGTNNGSPVKWRVLSTGDSKYGDGNSMLLWSDKQLGTNAYNPYYQNPDYAFWGTSQMRASLNGGDYYTGSSDTANPTVTKSVTEPNSYYGKLFNDDEKGSVVPTGTYTTDNWGINTSVSQYLYLKEGITVTTDSQNGKYNTNRISSSHPTSQYATVTAANGVQETTTNDKLFLLDYYDINDTSYGFGDGSLTYAKKVDSSWTPSSNKYPGYYDGAGSNWNKITSSYLSFSGEAANYCWLRPVGRVSAAYSSVLVVDSSGYVDYTRVSNSCGVRPAFNLDSTKIAYATATAPTASNSFDDLTISPATPEYKVYLKDSQYDSYTSSAKANARDENGNLYITYNNPTGISGGNILVLLSSKTATGGEVDYQAAFTVSSEASASKQAAATLTLPSGVSLSTHNVTLLYTSNNGGNSTETLYCSYSLDSGIDAPQNISGLTYDGNSKWISDLSSSEKPAWLDLDIYNNTAYMSVKSVEYTDTLGSAVKTVTTADIKPAGTYKVTMSIASGLNWSTGDSNDKMFTITINKKKSEPKPKVDPPIVGVPYESAGLPTLVADTGSTAGTFAWDTGEVATAGTKNYSWTFTPNEPNNFTVEKGSMQLEFLARELNGIAVKSYNPTGTVYTNTSLATIKSYLTVEATYTDGKTEPLTTYKLEVDSNDGKLHAGNNTLVITTNDDSQTVTYEITGVVEVSVSSITLVRLKSGSTFKYPVTTEEIKSAIASVSVQWNTGSSGNLDLSDLSVLTVSGTLNAGKAVTITIGVSGTTATKDITIDIAKGEYDISSSVFADKTVTYSGSAFDPDGWIDESKLPDGVSVTYSCETDLTAVGEHTVKATFTTTDNNYNNPAEMTAKLTITDKKLHDMSGVTVEGAGDGVTVEGDGESGFSASATYDPESTAGVTVGDLPANVTVKDTVYEKKQTDGTYVAVYGLPTDAGEYRVKVSFETDDPEYATPDDLVIDLTIAKADVDASGAMFKPSATNGLTAGGDGVYKATYDPDGNGFEFSVNDLDPDSIPAGATPKAPVYKKLVNGKWETVTEIKEAGEYKVVVEFDPADPANYNDGIAPVEIAIKIDEAYITGVIAKLEEGATFTADNTLDDLKAKLTAEIEYNNGTKETLKPEDFEVICNGLRENGKFKAGIQSVTVKYGDFETVVNLTVNKVKVAVPTFKGGLSYTGIAVKPTVENFNGYDSDIMTFVTDKTLSGLNAGSYKAVFALNDIENYEWATTSTMKKNLYSVALYDEEIQLVAGETAVDWDIKKAILTASRAEGALPEFTSESYKGALSGIVGLKYYKDEACTEEISSEELGYETTYYVKAELLDGDNFELDTSAAALTVAPVPYTTPAKELTFWEKVVVFLKANWLWLVIAVVALILLITIIALAVRASKKKQRRLAEEKAERLAREEREREERRLEREERMARLSQQQSAPQPQYIPQPMPQMMPQMQMPMSQPMAQQGGMAMGGGVSEAQFMQMQAELATLKAAQENMRAEQTAKELAAVRAEQAAMRAEQNTAKEVAELRNEITFAKRDDQVVQGGISIDKLTELIRTEVNNALDSREKSATQPAQQTESAATPASTQVPPDAVMTTVTTTKIDTTKKPVQNTNDRTPVGRPIVRNYVAPMPVDDGRVFDVGGFYKPADPVTDLGLTDDEDKKD